MCKLGYKHSKETIEKLRKSHTGLKYPPKTEEFRERMRISKLGKLNPMYGKSPANKGKKMGPAWNSGKEFSNSYSTQYKRIHIWLRRNFGNSDMCENINCKKESNHFEWSKKKGFEYEKNRNNFWKLCKRCHHQYDKTGTSGWITRRNNIKTNGDFPRTSRFVSQSGQWRPTDDNKLLFRICTGGKQSSKRRVRNRIHDYDDTNTIKRIR